MKHQQAKQMSIYATKNNNNNNNNKKKRCLTEI